MEKTELEKIADALWFQYVVCEGKDSITNPAELIKIINDVCKAQKQASVKSYLEHCEYVRQEEEKRGHWIEERWKKYDAIKKCEITLKHF